MKGKKNLRPILFVCLLIVLAITLLIPVETYSKVREMPGQKDGGQFGDTCECPHWPNFDCGCRILDPEM